MAFKLSIVLAVATACLLTSAGTEGRRLLQTSQTVQWQVPANGAYAPVSVPVGSTVTFTWSAIHDLWRISSGVCPASFTESNALVREAPQGRNGRKAITFDTPGTYHFACSVSTHCSEGQLIQITVTGSSSTASSGRGPAPAPGPARALSGRGPAPGPGPARALAPGPGSKASGSAPSAASSVSTASAVVAQPTEPSQPTEAEEPVEESEASEEEEHSEESEGYGGEGYEHNYRKR